MGFGSSKPKRNLFYVALKTAEKGGPLRPHFKITRYENKVKIDLADETEIFGKLVKLGHESYTHKDGTTESALLYIIDGDQLMKVSVNADSMLGRSIMNTIIGTQKFGEINIRVYINKKEGQDPMPGVYITNDGQKTSWKYDYAQELSPLIQTYPDPKNKGKFLKVYHDVNDLLMKGWNETAPIVEKHAKEMGYETINDKYEGTHTTEASHQQEPETSFENTVNNEVEGVDDLPF